MTDFRECRDDAISVVNEIAKRDEDSGVVICKILEIQNQDLSPSEIALRLFNCLGLGAPPRYEVDAPTCSWFLRQILQFCLVHHNRQLQEDVAIDLVQRFFRAVKYQRGDSKFWISGNPWLDSPTLRAIDGSAITIGQMSGNIKNATFAEGILLVTKQRVGIVWVLQED